MNVYYYGLIAVIFIILMILSSQCESYKNIPRRRKSLSKQQTPNIYDVDVWNMFPYRGAKQNSEGLFPLYPPVKGCGKYTKCNQCSECSLRSQVYDQKQTDEYYKCWESSECGTDFCPCMNDCVVETKGNRRECYSKCCKTSTP